MVLCKCELYTCSFYQPDVEGLGQPFPTRIPGDDVHLPETIKGFDLHNEVRGLYGKSLMGLGMFFREKEIPTSPPNKLCLLKQHHLPRWHLLSSSFHLAFFRGPHSGRPQAVGRKLQYQSLRKVLSHYFNFGIYGTYMIRNIVIHPYNFNQVFCDCSYFT